MSLKDFSINIKLGFEHLAILTVLMVFAAGILVGYSIWGKSVAETNQSAEQADFSSAQNGVALGQATPTAQGQPSIPLTVSEGGNPAIGPQDAPVTIIEFGDYQCPFCTQFYNQTLHQILQTYENQVRFVYRDFPLISIHPQAIPAAEAANCAGEQDKYWDYHDKLYSGGPQALGHQSYLSYAEELDLDMDLFITCLESERIVEEVQADLDYARSLGLRSTPSFFINGRWVIGAQPFEAFKQIIDSELSGTVN